MRKIYAIIMMLCMSILAESMEPKAVPIAENGQAKAIIVIPEKSSAIVRFAASELAAYLKKMTGAVFRVSNRAEHGIPTVIQLGMGKTDGFKPDMSMIRATGNTIEIFGRDTQEKKINLFDLYYDNPWKGTLTGVYRFLDRLGVRWYAPGERHEFVPQKRNLYFPEGTFCSKPFFADRQITFVWNFQRKFPDAKDYTDKSVDDVYLWLLRNGSSTRNMVLGSHSERSLRLTENEGWLAHPERHQLMKNGKRNPKYSCWSDPGTIELWKKATDAYFSGKRPQDAGLDLPGYLNNKWPYPFLSPDEFMIDPMDHDDTNDGRCYCERCNMFRKKYPCSDDTELIWRALREIALDVKKKHPGKYISTLAYGIKKQIPEHTVIPDNIRVRICDPGAKDMIFPDSLEKNMKIIRFWSKLLGKDNLPLWTYQCICFARTAPGVPDIYPGLTFQYIQKIRPYTAGMYLENIALTHTMRNLDSYLFLRGMWNPDMDFQKEREEYFKNYYGNAGAGLSVLFAELEEKWCDFWRLTGGKEKQLDTLVSTNDRATDSALARKKMQLSAWSKIYTQEFLNHVDSVLKKAEKSVADSALHRYRVGLLRTWLFQIMQSERAEVMSKEDIRKKLELHVGKYTGQSFPADSEWRKLPSEKLVPAKRHVPKLLFDTSFQAIASADKLFIRAEMKDVADALSNTDKKRRNGNADIWKDNCIELFLHAEKSRRFWQIFINDSGVWSSQTNIPGKPLPKWIQYPGLEVTVKRVQDGWTADITIPLASMEINAGELRFNLTRERNQKKVKTEYSTWSPLGMLGNWHDPNNYATVYGLSK